MYLNYGIVFEANVNIIKERVLKKPNTPFNIKNTDSSVFLDLKKIRKASLG